MAETREPSTRRDDDQVLSAGNQRDIENQAQQAVNSTAQHETEATAAVPRGPNTPNSLEQPHDLGDLSTDIGIHMHPASLTSPEQDLEMTEGDESAVP